MKFLYCENNFNELTVYTQKLNKKSIIFDTENFCFSVKINPETARKSGTMNTQFRMDRLTA